MKGHSSISLLSVFTCLSQLRSVKRHWNNTNHRKISEISALTSEVYQETNNSYPGHQLSSEILLIVKENSKENSSQTAVDSCVHSGDRRCCGIVQGLAEVTWLMHQ